MSECKNVYRHNQNGDYVDTSVHVLYLIYVPFLSDVSACTSTAYVVSGKMYRETSVFAFAVNGNVWNP